MDWLILLIIGYFIYKTSEGVRNPPAKKEANTNNAILQNATGDVKLNQKYAFSDQGEKIITPYDVSKYVYVLKNPVVNPTQIPSSYDARNLKFTLQVLDQWIYGTCWAFSAADTLQSNLLAQYKVNNIEKFKPYFKDSYFPFLSEQYIDYYNAKSYAIGTLEGNTGTNITYTSKNALMSGGFPIIAFYTACKLGIPPYQDFPYQTSIFPYVLSWFTSTPWWNPTTPDWNKHLSFPHQIMVIPSADTFGNEKYTYSDYINVIKSAIMGYGSISISNGQPIEGQILGLFNHNDNFCYTLEGFKSIEGISKNIPFIKDTLYQQEFHAQNVIGWDENFKYNGKVYPLVWIIQNSWGPSFGDNGVYRIPALTENEYNYMAKTNWYPKFKTKIEDTFFKCKFEINTSYTALFKYPFTPQSIHKPSIKYTTTSKTNIHIKPLIPSDKEMPILKELPMITLPPSITKINVMSSEMKVIKNTKFLSIELKILTNPKVTKLELKKSKRIWIFVKMLNEGVLSSFNVKDVYGATEDGIWVSVTRKLKSEEQNMNFSNAKIMVSLGTQNPYKEYSGNFFFYSNTFSQNFKLLQNSEYKSGVSEYLNNFGLK